MGRARTPPDREDLKSTTYEFFIRAVSVLSIVNLVLLASRLRSTSSERSPKPDGTRVRERAEQEPQARLPSVSVDY